MFKIKIAQGADSISDFSLSAALLASRSNPAFHSASGSPAPYIAADGATAIAIKSPNSLAAPPLPVAGAYTINFDDLITNGGGVAITNGYDGYNWAGIYSVNIPSLEAAVGTNTGYTKGEVSPDNIAITASNTQGVITATDGGALTLKSVHLASALNSSMQIDVYGYQGALQKYHLIYSVGDTTSALANLNFKNVDKVTFVASNEVHDPSQSFSGTQIVFDDFSFAAGSIAGTVFKDANGNGAKNAPDTGLAGRTVFIDANGNGVLDPGESQKVSAADGSVTFTNLLPGDYSVYQILPDNWVQTTQNPLSSYVATTAGYGWVEIGQAANKLTLTDLDDGGALISTPALARFFGSAQASFFVSTNGFLDTVGGNTFSNPQLPNTSYAAGYGGIIAPYWDDLNFLGASSGIYFEDDAAHHRYIVEWRQAGFFNDPTNQHVTFEAIIGYDGTISYEYNQLDVRGTGATVGIANIDQTLGNTINYNSTSLLSHSAYTLTPILLAPAAVVHVSSGQVSHVGFGSLPASNPHAPHADPVLPHAFASMLHVQNTDFSVVHFAQSADHMHMNVAMV